MNGGKLMRAVDMAKAEASRQTKSLLNKALQANTAGALAVRLRPRNNSQQLAGRAAKTQQLPDDEVGLPSAVQCR